MKPHALALAISALSAATAMAQGVGDRYGYSRTDYDSQQGHYAYGRALTWANKTNFDAPPPPYDARDPRNGDPRNSDQSRGHDIWNQRSQPGTGAPQVQAYAPQLPPNWRPPAQSYNREPLRPQVYSQSQGDQGQSAARSYDPAPPRPRIYGQINGNFYGRTLTPQSQMAQMEQAARVYGSASNPTPNAPQAPYTQQVLTANTRGPQPSEATIQGGKSYDATPIQARTYGQSGQDVTERVQEARSAPSSQVLARASASPTAGQAPARQQNPQAMSDSTPQAEPVRSAQRPNSATTRLAIPVADQGGGSRSPPAPVRMAETDPPGRGQVHLYSLHREYGLKPDAIPAPNPNQGLVLIGPGEAPVASNKALNQDDEPAKEKAF